MPKGPYIKYCKCWFCEEFFPLELKGKGSRARPFCGRSCKIMYGRYGGKKKSQVMGNCLLCPRPLNRTNQKYCSNACRQRAYNIRKAG